MSQISDYDEASNAYVKIANKNRSVREELESGNVVK